MQTTDATYAALLAADAPREVRAVIAGTTYGQDKIVSAKSAAAVLKGNQLVGNCISAQLNLSLREPGTIPRMAEIDVGVRLNDGTTQSGWLPKGTFYIDTRTQEDDVLKITAYDAMLKTEQSFTRSGDQGEWPRTDISVVNEIAQRIGVSVDARTTALMSRGYLVQYPGIVLEDGTPKYSADGGLTMREVLGYIGVMYGGDWVISDAGELRLVPFAIFPFINPLNTDNPALGEIVYFNAYPDIKWHVDHVDGDYAYLGLYTLTETTQFNPIYGSLDYAGSTIASKCTTFLNNTIPNVAKYLEDVTVEGVTNKVFIPTYYQMSGKAGTGDTSGPVFTYIANASGDTRKTIISNDWNDNPPNYGVWLSSPNNSWGIWYVDNRGEFYYYEEPDYVRGFRPEVKVKFKEST